MEDCGRAGGLSATAQDKGDKAASGSQLATLYSDVKIAASTVTHHPLQLTFLTDSAQPHLDKDLTSTMAFVGVDDGDDDGEDDGDDDGVDDGDDDGDDVADNDVGSSISRSHNQQVLVFYSIFFPLTIHPTFFTFC